MTYTVIKFVAGPLYSNTLHVTETFSVLFLPSNKVKFEASNLETSNHEQYPESKGSEENNERDGEVSNDEEERIVERSEEENNKDVEIKGKDELIVSEGEGEEIEDKADNEEKTGKEEITDVDKDAILGAFLQVSEPGLVSAHHDGFLRFWDLSVSCDCSFLWRRRKFSDHRVNANNFVMAVISNDAQSKQSQGK